LQLQAFGALIDNASDAAPGAQARRQHPTGGPGHPRSPAPLAAPGRGPGSQSGRRWTGTLAVDRGLRLSVAWGSRAPSRRSVERRRVRVRPSRARRSARRQVVVDLVKGDLRRVRNATAAYSDNTGSARLTVDAAAIDTTRTAGVSSLAKGRDARTLACPAARRPRSRPHQARRRRVRRRPARRRRGEATRRRLPAHGRDRRSRGPEPQRPPRRCRLRCGQCALEAAQRPDELPPAVRPPARTSSGSRVSIPNLVTPITLPFSTPAPPAPRHRPPTSSPSSTSGHTRIVA